MKIQLSLLCVLVAVGATVARPESTAPLPVNYEELNAPDFVEAVKRSGGVCLLPFGIVEKHAAHLPLATDLLAAREIANRAAAQEYCLVFPPYYFGQINEARHQPGTLAYSPELIWKLLQETCDELSRNGIKKIIVVNGHGGNNDFLRFFGMSQLHRPKDYALMIFTPAPNAALEAKVAALETKPGGHADLGETAMILSIRPELVQLSRARSQSGDDQARLAPLPDQYTGIWWYARFPNHYAGDATGATAELGRELIEAQAEQLAALVRKVKASDAIGELQREFYQQAAEPLKTKQ